MSEVPIGNDWSYRLHKLAYLFRYDGFIYDGIERVMIDMDEIVS